MQTYWLNSGLSRLADAPIAITRIVLPVAAIAAIVCIPLRPEVNTHQVNVVSGVAHEGDVAQMMQPPSPAGIANESGRRALASHLSHRYRIANEAAEMLVDITYETGEQAGLDPLLILAVMAIESRFNPIAESGTGAQGLMQVIPKYHWDKLGGEESHQSALSPTTNIRLGTRILKEYIENTGSLEAGLQKYNGASSDTDNHYAQKILEERLRYLQIVHPPIAFRSDERGNRGQYGSQPSRLNEANGTMLRKPASASLPM